MNEDMFKLVEFLAKQAFIEGVTVYNQIAEDCEDMDDLWESSDTYKALRQREKELG